LGRHPPGGISRSVTAPLQSSRRRFPGADPGAPATALLRSRAPWERRGWQARPAMKDRGARLDRPRVRREGPEGSTANELVVVVEQEGDSWGAAAPDHPGCVALPGRVAAGRSRDEVEERTAEAIPLPPSCTMTTASLSSLRRARPDEGSGGVDHPALTESAPRPSVGGDGPERAVADDTATQLRGLAPSSEDLPGAGAARHCPWPSEKPGWPSKVKRPSVLMNGNPTSPRRASNATTSP